MLSVKTISITSVSLIFFFIYKTRIFLENWFDQFIFVEDFPIENFTSLQELKSSIPRPLTIEEVEQYKNDG